ncbi:esterase/lipase family protein [Williamsia herbipolensis]|uniref:esterase/lipase family protein n=1 Tax=Williamsia herbipolensis TaxID=1603258 RepID=UPI0005F8699C|nr:alpha/beta fold hydrolase [Williamsia herbipolensis]
MRTRSTSVVVRTLVGLLLAAGAVTASVVPASAAPLPVSYNFFSGIPYALGHPGGSLPGSNDFRCRPTAEHPNPVVLVHGTGGGSMTNWGTYVPLLRNEGYCVFALTYGTVTSIAPFDQVGGMGRIETSAAQLRTFVDRVRQATGAAKVDIVGHSQGTLMPTWFVRYLDGASSVGRYVSLAPLWNGTGGAVGAQAGVVARRLGITETGLPVCAACGQMQTGSALLAEVNAGGGPYVPGIAYTNISTMYDEAVIPYTSGQVAGRPGDDVTNFVVQNGCSADHSDHVAVAASRRAATYVLNALDPAHPRSVPCLPVLPIVG